MNENQKLEQIFKDSITLPHLNDKELNYLTIIIQNAYQQKGVWTVLITLLFYKILNPTQDIRYHKVELKNGFSGRSFDTKIVTPTLRKLELPAMAESGWLTRSLEQAYPYTLDYNGKIANKKLKESFLNLLNIIQSFKEVKQGANKANDFLSALFVLIKQETKKHKIHIIPLKKRENISINQIIAMLDSHFQYKYNTFGTSKLPVLAFYSIYQILIKELKRYKKCTLQILGSHTASDRTSKSAGDIEIYKNDKLYEAIEIKFNKEINSDMIDIAYNKIIKFSPKRYSIFSTSNIKEQDKNLIVEKIDKIKNEHGCQVIVNGVLSSIKYYLRLIDSPNVFIENYSKLIEKDIEIKIQHKEYWNEIVKKNNA